MLFLLIAVYNIDILTLTNNGPAPVGTNVTFTATIHNYKYYGGQLIFWDDAQPHHQAKIPITSNITQWIVEYRKDYYEAKLYTIRVNWVLPYIPIVWARAVTILNLTDLHPPSVSHRHLAQLMK